MDGWRMRRIGTVPPLGRGESVMVDRWYMPLMVATSALVALLIGGLAVIEVLTAKAVSEPPAARWQAALARMDDAIDRADFADAARRWREASEAARHSREWTAQIEVGDGYRRLQRTGRIPAAMDGVAREAYFNALLRARHDGSLEGVLRAAESFAALGDAAVVEQCLHIAHRLAARDVDPVAARRVQMFADRWAARTLEVERARATGRP
jgi:hypothetical protein